MKRPATEEEQEQIHKRPRLDQESISSTLPTSEVSRVYQHDNSPPSSQPTAASIAEPPQLTSHTHTTPPVTCRKDSNTGSIQGDIVFQNLVSRSQHCNAA